MVEDDAIGIVSLSVTEDETGIYLDSNQGWVVEVVHWPRSPSRLKRPQARAFAKQLADAWNEKQKDRRIKDGSSTNHSRVHRRG